MQSSFMEMKDFDPDGTGLDNGNYFGLPCTAEESRLVLLSVPWDVTASYGGGAAFGPDAIIGASSQLDLYDGFHPGGWREGIGTVGIDYSIQERSIFLRGDAQKVMSHLESGGSTGDEYVKRKIARINEGSRWLNDRVYGEASSWLDRGRLVGLVGGDHSTPLGFVRALAEREGALGVLHVDAHRDLRAGYEGFDYSHASIMYNVLKEVPGVERLVQVAVRDFCDGEEALAGSDSRVVSFDDYLLARNRFGGMTWREQCARIAESLPAKVYVSFDIDGLSPELCPHTGTPVAGGLSFHEAVFLLDAVVASGRRIVGFDLCEVAPAPDHENEWDANVGARVLYKLCNFTLKSNPK